MGFIYLLHFDRPYKHAKHYLGYSEEKPDERITKHYEGKSKVKLLEVVRAAGIDYNLARVWENKTRLDEKNMKKRGKGDICPVCKKEKRQKKELNDLQNALESNFVGDVNPDDFQDPWSYRLTVKGYNIIVYDNIQLELFGSEDKGFCHHRVEFNEKEKIFYEQWKDQNVATTYLNSGLGTLQDIFLDYHTNIKYNIHLLINHRDRYVAATLMQWLGSNCGMAFIETALKRMKMIILTEKYYNSWNEKISDEAEIIRELRKENLALKEKIETYERYFEH